MDPKANRGSDSLSTRASKTGKTRKPRKSEKGWNVWLWWVLSPALRPLAPSTSHFPPIKSSERLWNVRSPKCPVYCTAPGYLIVLESLPFTAFELFLKLCNCAKPMVKRIILFLGNANEFCLLEVKMIIDLWLLISFSSICKFISWWPVYGSAL